MFQLVSQCQPGTLQNYNQGFTLANITASLEMDTCAPSSCMLLQRCCYAIHSGNAAQP